MIYNARRVNPAKAIYHKFIPESVRSPIGMSRRRLADRWTRLVHRGPLPPSELFAHLQTTPFVSEFIRSGERAANAIRCAIDGCLPPSAPVLDFRCGSGRTLLPLSRTTTWELSGCDADAAAVRWLSEALGSERVRSTPASGPLPFRDASFDALYAVSAFTHFTIDEQRAWSVELARVLVPGGLAVVSTMGPGILGNFPAQITSNSRATLLEEGLLVLDDSSSVNHCLAFHTPGGVARIAAPEFELWQHLERGLDGFEDLAVLVKR